MQARETNRWRVFISIDPAELEALRAAAPEAVPRETYEFTEWDAPPELAGDIELSIDVAGVDEEEATAAVEELYGRWRAVAGLGHAEGGLLALIALYEDASSRALIKAERLWHGGRFEESVVFAQVACETRAGEVFDELLRSRGLPEGAAPNLVRTPSMMNKHHRRLLTTLTGKRIQDEDWWATYRRHVERRHLVAHRGAAVTPQQADESWKVALAFQQFFDTLPVT